ncbi:YihY/virulence factor BrkB family protein [Segetibacter koreensis]|uniref:YihY/virulence factor BrkB family protein n=1 Tax=Segetibacter koreensis TaxID=398037 RepID=UPI00036427B2|nr:YihY/virulence factor BrkB family protein [Segetibacter koreensis]
MLRIRVKELVRILSVSFDEFKSNDPLRLAGATAFFTTFALPPILIILVQVIGLVFKIENLRNRFFSRLAETLGRQSAAQVKETFSGFTALAKNWVITICGFIFLMFVATTLFKVIKDSLNQLWKVKAKTKKPIKVQLKSRAISMLVILLSGILFIGGMITEGFVSVLREYTGELQFHTANSLKTILNHGVSILIVTAWFSILFKVLPDAKASWKVVIAGGFFTGILFTAGKIVIRYALSLGNIKNVFGASSSLVLLLLFMFYSSFILYYGACFTKVFASFINEPIEAGENAVKYKIVEVKNSEEI